MFNICFRSVILFIFYCLMKKKTEICGKLKRHKKGGKSDVVEYAEIQNEL